MLIAVCNDAHGARGNMDDLLDALPEIDALCFLGDMDKDAEYLDWGLREKQPGAAFHAVAGNNDPFSHRARAMELTFGGIPVFITHGHMYSGIRSSRRVLAAAMQSMRARLVLYGHTHIRQDETIGGIRLINPGALMRGEWALLRFENDTVSITMCTL